MQNFKFYSLIFLGLLLVGVVAYYIFYNYLSHYNSLGAIQEQISNNSKTNVLNEETDTILAAVINQIPNLKFQNTETITIKRVKVIYTIAINIVNVIDIIIDKIEIYLLSYNPISSYYKLFEYLDTLILLQETALLNILILIIVMLTVINILAVLFANEMIKYLNLEEKYPALSKFLRLRAKF